MGSTHVRGSILLFLILSLGISASSTNSITIRAETITKEFFVGWHYAAFTMNVTLEDTWDLPRNYDVSIIIKLSTELGEKSYLYLDAITIGIEHTGIHGHILVNKTLRHAGEAYSAKANLKSDAGFTALPPGEMSPYTFYIDVEGDVWFYYTTTYYSAYRVYYESSSNSLEINVRSPAAPIILSTSFSKDVIRIGDIFNLTISLTNDGDHPVTDLEIEEAAEPRTIEVLGPNEKQSFVIQVEAYLTGMQTVHIHLYYRTFTGYKVMRYEDVRYLVKKKLSTIACEISSQKISKGDQIKVFGKLIAASRRGNYSAASYERVILNFAKPDGKSVAAVLTTNIDGNYSYEFTPDLDGSWTVRANWAGDFEYENATSQAVSFTVEKRGCIIATAAYGSELAPELQFLRDFRDRLVYSTFAGAQFMEAFEAWYYSFSPPIAALIDESSLIRQLVRIALYPLIFSLHISTVVYSAFSFNGEVAVIMAGLGASMLIGTIYVSPIALLSSYVAKRFGKSVRKASLLRSVFVLWLMGVGMIVMGELATSRIVLMIATGATVILTIALCAIGIASKLVK